MMSHKLKKKICNGYACFVVNDMISNTLESMQSLRLSRSDDYLSSSKHLEASMQRNDCFNQVGHEFATTKLRDSCAQKCMPGMSMDL